MKTAPSEVAFVPTAYRILRKFFTLDITHLMILHASDVTSSPDCEGYAIQFLSADDVRRFSGDARIELDEAVASRLASPDHFCVGLIAPDGALVSYTWFALGAIEADHNHGNSIHGGTAVSFPSQLAFAYNGFTHPEFRGRGFLRAINAFTLAELARRVGVTAIVTTTDWTNRAALRSCYSLGFRYVGHVMRFGWRGMVAGIYPAVAAQYGIKFGTQATPRTPAAKAEIAHAEAVCG